jgi:DsbC/DsbD-like thiol-disulfide interchange protein
MTSDRRAPRTAAAALAISLGCVVCTAVPAGTAEKSPADESPHVTIEALADHADVGPGQTFQVAVVQHIKPGWHTYWINPGDAGQATKLNWSLPAGYRIEDVQWPIAEVFRSGPIVSYGYEGTVALLQNVHSPASTSSQPATLSVEAHWLECQDICIPGQARAQVTVRQTGAAPAETASPAKALFQRTREQLPKAAVWRSSLAVDPKKVVVTLYGLAHDLPSDSDLHFLPLTWGQIDNAAPQQVQRSGADVLLTLTRGDLRAAPLDRLAGVLILGPGNGHWQTQGFQLDATTGGGAAAPRN